MIKRAKALSSAALLLVTTILVACGNPAATTSNLKIRNGNTVTLRDYGPHATSTVGLAIETYEGRSICSAALIADQVLVTAAHCVPQDATITAFFDLNLERAQQRRRLVHVNSAAVHPSYISNGMEIAPHDIALLGLESPAPSDYKAVPVLKNDKILAPGDQVLLAGFGITEYGEDSGVLRYTQSTYVGKDENSRLEINDAQRRGACSGDSGGPMYVRTEGDYQLAGVLSGGPIPCRGINFYTSVAANAEFVKRALAQISKK